MKKQNNIKKKFFITIINLLLIAIVFFSFYKLSGNETMVVDAIAVNVRSGPGVSYDIQSQVTRGTEIKVLEKQSDWYKIAVDGKTKGWVASWLLTKNETTTNANITATVNTENTKLRKENNTSSTILTELKKGDIVTVSKEKESWVRVTYNSQTGWIHADLLDYQRSSKDTANTNTKVVYTIQDETNIRETADVSGDLVTQVALGTELTVLSTEDDWYKVQTLDKQTGYVASWVVTLVKEDTETSSGKISTISESTIMIDPGHGGDDPGAESTNGVYEKKITLQTANYIKDELEALGANVILTRTTDKSVSLAKRPELSNQYQVDAFISLHYDSTEDTNVASGTTTYYYAKKDLDLADSINKQLKELLPLENRGVEYGDLQVLRDNDQPAILLELGYLSNSYDSSYAVTKAYQKQVADAVAQGLQNYFKH